MEQKIYYIRHKMSGSEIFNSELKTRKIIAYHFNDEYHDKIDDYSEDVRKNRGFIQAYNAFMDITRNGAIVVAEFDDSNVFIIAEIEKGTKTIPAEFIYKGNKLVYKTMQYSKDKEYKYSNYPVLAAIKPPYSTICSPGKYFCRVIRRIRGEESGPPTVNDLHPKMLEVLCETYLRSDLAPEDIQIKYCLVKTGKTMPEVDIIAKSKTGKAIYAQVTHFSGGEAREKAKRLVAFVKDQGITIMFSKNRDKLTVDELNYHFCIDDVFEDFVNHADKSYQVMIEEMIKGKIQI